MDAARDHLLTKSFSMLAVVRGARASGKEIAVSFRKPSGIGLSAWPHAAQGGSGDWRPRSSLLLCSGRERLGHGS
jgi:hypothetical protein